MSRDRRITHVHHDVVVIGGGSAGVAAALASAKTGAKTLLVDAGPMVGGELLSGLPINSMISARGEWVVGGMARELVDECARLGGYVGHFFDWRSLWLVCIDPEIMKLAVVNLLHRYGVAVWMYTVADDVVMEGDVVKGIVVLSRGRRFLLTANAYLDCSGDGDVAVAAGAPYESGGSGGAYQPVSMIFRLVGVESEPFLRFVRDHPENVALGELPLIDVDKATCAQRLYEQGYPKAFFDGRGPLLAQGFASGEIAETGLLAVVPVSTPRKEVSINTTRVPLDATQADALSAAMPVLLDQVWRSVAFLQRRVPGFENAAFSGIAPRIGIRETRRITGRQVLTQDDVLEARKSDEGIGKGAHELDIHGGGREHTRLMLKDGGSYDIPFGCLIPNGVSNLLVAGRCISATREAMGSSRVMGSCMSTGHAAGTAAAMASADGLPASEVDVAALRDALRTQGAILEGTY